MNKRKNNQQNITSIIKHMSINNGKEQIRYCGMIERNYME